MKNTKVLLVLLPVILLLYSCSKGNEHLSRDLYTAFIPITFDIPAIALADTSITITEVKSSINLDSIIKRNAGASFGAADIKSIKLRSIKMDVVNFDTTYNFRLIDSLQLRLRAGTDTTKTLAQAISNPDISSQTLNLPLSPLQPELKSIMNMPSFLYLITGRIRRQTTKAFKATITAQYKITVGD
jgi:hypothetical protein